MGLGFWIFTWVSRFWLGRFRQVLRFRVLKLSRYIFRYFLEFFRIFSDLATGYRWSAPIVAAVLHFLRVSVDVTSGFFNLSGFFQISAKLQLKSYSCVISRGYIVHNMWRAGVEQILVVIRCESIEKLLGLRQLTGAPHNLLAYSRSVAVWL